MDETAIAFEAPWVRAAAAPPPGPLDRISVRDYTRVLEIGAFRSERGVTQRVRFNVVLEVAHGAAGVSDDVDRVLSYDTITEAIETALAAERLNLLETLAERVAAGCLEDPRAIRAFVRVEKLDRIPGALGVEIVRMRLPEGAPRLHPVVASRSVAAPRPLVVHLPAPDEAWLDAFAALGRPAVLTLGPAAPQAAATTEGALRAGLMAVETAVWLLADRDPRLTVASSRTELDWALKTGRLPVWAPTHMIVDALPRPALDASRPEALAAWLGAEIGAEALVLAGPGPAPETVTVTDLPLRRAAAPGDLA